MQFHQKNVLITGGSSGIGLALARRLVSAGASVWLLARDPARLDAALQSLLPLRAHPDQPVGALPGDVSDWPALQTLVERHVRQHGPVELLINCAGVARPGLFAEMDVDVFRSMMEINYFGTLHAIKAVLPGMVARRAGWVVNVSSVAGFLGVYGYSAYGPSKFAVRGLSDALRGELAEHGIGISVVFPPDTQTPQLDYENAYKPPILAELDKSNKVLSADAVAEAILKGVSRGRYVITPGADSTLFFALTNFFGLVYPVMDRMVAQARRAVRRS